MEQTLKTPETAAVDADTSSFNVNNHERFLELFFALSRLENFRYET